MATNTLSTEGSNGTVVSTAAQQRHRPHGKAAQVRIGFPSSAAAGMGEGHRRNPCVWTGAAFLALRLGWHVTRCMVFSRFAGHHFARIPAGLPWHPKALPKRPRGLSILTTAGGSNKSHSPYAVLRGPEPTSVSQGSCLPGQQKAPNFIRF